MAVRADKLQIIKYPDPRLRQRSKPVRKVDPEIIQIADRMIELMHEAKGVGLAAPQLGILLRLFVCQPGDDAEPHVFMNPVLRLGDEDAEAEEGCLSIPEVSVMVRRAMHCEITALDRDGQLVTLAADGLAARVWQHETDHLDGRLITDRMTETEKIANRKLLKEMEREFEKARKKK